MNKDYIQINSETIDGWVKNGWEWGRPIDHDTWVKAVQGDWKVYLYLENPEGKIVENPQADITLSQILPGEQVKTAILFATEKVTNLLREGYRLSVGIEDPMTDRPQVRLAMNCKYKNGKNILWDGLK